MLCDDRPSQFVLCIRLSQGHKSWVVLHGNLLELLYHWFGFYYLPPGPNLPGKAPDHAFHRMVKKHTSVCLNEDLSKQFCFR